MTSFNSLSRLSQLNVEMDQQAKFKLRSLLAARAPPLVKAGLQHEGWLCVVDGVKNTADPSPAIRFSISSRELQQHLQECDMLPAASFWMTDWAALDQAMVDFPALYRMWMSKHVSGFFWLWENDATLGLLDAQPVPMLHTYQRGQGTSPHLPGSLLCGEME
jgi:hypothetical protein